MRKNERSVSMNHLIPFGISLRMKPSARAAAVLGARNLFRSGDERTEVPAPVRHGAPYPSGHRVEQEFGDAEPCGEFFCDCLRNRRPVNVIKMTPHCD